MANTATSVLALAAAEIGYDRFKDPEKGTKYGRWYAQLVKSSYYGESGVPYCAMFASYIFAQAKAVCSGLPGAYCPTMLAVARKAGKVLSNKRNAQPGDVVYFDWNGDGVVDHVGIIEKNLGTSVLTIEGNTSSGVSGSQNNGGVVARRNRSWGTIYAIVRPSYSASASADGKLDVDGWLGSNSVRAWQVALGTYADGVVSGQDSESCYYFPALVSVTYEGDGSQLVEAVQTWLGKKGYKLAIDGYLGPETISAIQKWLNTQGYSLDVDGYLGAMTAKALQRSLNDGKWK